MLNQMITINNSSIIAYEHDKLSSCNGDCLSCDICKENCCINYCKPVYFEELKEYCSKENQDCGFGYDYKEKSIKFEKYTGIIQLKDGTYLEILPKITHDTKLDDSRKIFQNLIFASHNLTKEYKDSLITNSQIHKSNYIIEIFISVFCKDLKEILKRGIKKSYIRKEENLNNYKGKLKFSEHIKRNSVTKNKFYVEYSEFSIDVPENRILKSACLSLLKMTKNDESKKTLRRALIEFDDVSPCFNLEKELQDKQINRLHQYYLRPLQYAEFFLRKQSFMPYKGKKALPSLLFPLNDMFEDYIENILKDNDIRFRKQFSPYYLAKDNGKDIFKTKMDYAYFDGKIAIVLDAKWKVLDPEKDNYGVSQDDLYQLFAYSEIIKANKPIENISIALLYPKTVKFNEIKNWKYFNGTEIFIVPVNVLEPDNNAIILSLFEKVCKRVEV